MKKDKKYSSRKEIDELIQEDRALQREEEKRRSKKRRKGRKKMSFDEFVELSIRSGGLL